MEEEREKICAEGLAFFGRTNRFISHELKNILAIISETLGLIDELLELSGSGRKLDPEKLRTLSKSVIEEVERANGIIKNMNAFGHSVDEFLEEVDINQNITLMIRLLHLDPSSRKTSIGFQEFDSGILYTSPFFLGNLIYGLLKYSIDNAGPEKKIEIKVGSVDNGIRVIMAGLADKRTTLPGKSTVLAGAISARLSFDDAAGELRLDLPARIQEGLLDGFVKDNEES